MRKRKRTRPLNDAQRALAETGIPQVTLIANKLLKRLPLQIEFDDLESAGMVGLLSAARRFKSSRGVKFSTFASQRILGAMLDSLRTDDMLPRSARRARRAAEDGHLVVSQLEDAFAKKLCSDATPVDEIFHFALAIARILPRVDNPRHRLLLQQYYFDGRTLNEIRETLGISKSRIWQLHAEALSAARKIAADMGMFRSIHICREVRYDARRGEAPEVAQDQPGGEEPIAITQSAGLSIAV